MREPQLQAAPAADRLEQTVPLQPGEDSRRSDAFEHARLDRLFGTDELEELPLAGLESADPRLDQLEQARPGHDRSTPTPDAADACERAPREPLPYELVQVEGIPLGGIPKSVRRRSPDIAVEHLREERGDVGFRERLQLDVVARPVFPERHDRIRHRLAGADCGDHERPSARGEPVRHGGRGAVEQVRIVDRERQRASIRPLEQRPHGSLKERKRAAYLALRLRQQVGEGAVGDGGRRMARGRPGRGVPLLFGLFEDCAC